MQKSNNILSNQKSNILLTGVPRSGSTLALKILSTNNNIVCLDEPGWLKNLRKLELAEQIPNELHNKLVHIRNKIFREEPIEITVAKGTNEIPDNHFKRQSSGIVNNKSTILKTFPKNNFKGHCVIKSNIFFSSVLENLIKNNQFQIIVTIRNPIAIIKSWRSLSFSLSKGRSMIAEKYSPELRKLNNETDILKKQVLLLDWFFKQYYHNKDKIQIIKYEKFIEEPEILFSELELNLLSPQNVFKSKNNNQYYDHSETYKIVDYLKYNCCYYKYFYPSLSE